MSWKFRKEETFDFVGEDTTMKDAEERAFLQEAFDSLISLLCWGIPP